VCVACQLTDCPSLPTQYNAVLRGVPRLVPFYVERFDKWCQGNLYPGTLHSINDALIRLSRISMVQKLYRGVGCVAVSSSLPPTPCVPIADKYSSRRCLVKAG
jgi:hypothetical protein